MAANQRTSGARRPKSARTSAAAKAAEATAEAPPHSGDINGWRQRVVDRSLERARARSLERGYAFIQAALELMHDGDDERTGFTLQEVADAAGQSLRTFYQHFANKDELLLALLEESTRINDEFIRESVDKQRDPLDRLVAFIHSGTAIVGRSPYARALTRYSVELGLSAPDAVAGVNQPVLALARELVAEAVEAGAIPECDPAVAAHFIVTLRSSYLHATILGNQIGDVLPSRDDVVRFCLNGLSAPER